MKLQEIIVIGAPERTKHIYQQFVSFVEEAESEELFEEESFKKERFKLDGGHDLCHIKSFWMDIIITRIEGQGNPKGQDFALRENCTVLFCPPLSKNIDYTQNIHDIANKRAETSPSSQFFNVIPIYVDPQQQCSSGFKTWVKQYPGYCRQAFFCPKDNITKRFYKLVLFASLATPLYRELINAKRYLQALELRTKLLEAIVLNDQKSVYRELNQCISDVKNCLTTMQQVDLPDKIMDNYYGEHWGALPDSGCSKLRTSLRCLEGALERLELRYDPYWEHAIYNVFYSIGNILALMSCFRTCQAYNRFLQNHQNHGGRFGYFTFFALSHSQQIRDDFLRIDQQVFDLNVRSISLSRA